MLSALRSLPSLRRLATALVLARLAVPGLVAAQADGWLEQDGQAIAIVYPAGAEPFRDYFAERADAIYGQLSSAFADALELPVTLRLYRDDAAFLAANPLFVEVGGVLAQARRGRREVAISLPRALGASDPPAPIPGQLEPRLDNALRLELAYLFVAHASADRLPAGFQSGLAQYLLQPSEATASGVARLRDARDAAALHDWSALNAAGAEYLDPALAQPESLAIVHFLVERQGFARLLEFVRANASAAGWREALEDSYGMPPSQLAAEWEAWLPRYLDGGWRQHALYSADLGSAEDLMRRGDFAAAAMQLSSTVSLLESIDPVAAEAARERLSDAEAGLAARRRAGEAAAALQAGRYAEAAEDGEAALEGLTRLGDEPGSAYATALLERARMGVAAEADLDRARRLPAWRVAEARQAGHRAMQGFAKIGNTAAAGRARDRVVELDRRQAPLGWALTLVGLALIARSLRRRLATGAAA
ncbi:MAG: hypothetical protein H6648_03510 [Caldilineae bacterium]|nr:hypothetical protein [Caldilineae bacterium]